MIRVNPGCSPVLLPSARTNTRVASAGEDGVTRVWDTHDLARSWPSVADTGARY